MPEAHNFFTEQQEEQIVASIKEAESYTSGEIRVHLDDSTQGDEWEKAVSVFYQLRMNETALRNGILFHIRINNKTFSIVADEGINRVVSEGFWDEIKDQMRMDFKQGNICEGLCKGILKTGVALKEYFPFREDDRDELPNEISK